jgi:hypothetical protein
MSLKNSLPFSLNPITRFLLETELGKAQLSYGVVVSTSVFDSGPLETLAINNLRPNRNNNKRNF